MNDGGAVPSGQAAAPPPPILWATASVPDVAEAAGIWRRWFGWTALDAGRVSAEQAAAWRTPAARRAPWRLLASPGGLPGGLRLVQAPPLDGYRPLTTLGWAALELLVEDVTALGARLAASGLPILGHPRPLGGDPASGLAAMQVLAPGGVPLYLTQVDRSPPSMDLPRARCDVDRLFIAVLGVADMPGALRWCERTLKARPNPVESWPIDVLTTAFDLPPGSRFPLATVPLTDGFLIEIDGYPPAATPRPRAAGHLPPGVVSLTLGTKGDPATAGRVEAGPGRALVEFC